MKCRNCGSTNLEHSVYVLSCRHCGVIQSAETTISNKELEQAKCLVRHIENRISGRARVGKPEDLMREIASGRLNCS